MKKMIGTMVAAMIGMALSCFAMSEWSNEFMLGVGDPLPAVELMPVEYDPAWGGADLASVSVDDRPLLVSKEAGSFAWRPLKPGTYRFAHMAGTNKLAVTVTVSSTPYAYAREPAPPMKTDEAITISPTGQSFGLEGGHGEVTTKGIGDWSAAVSDDWIILMAPEGHAGMPVQYKVKESYNAEARYGYVYVSGHVFEVLQAGRRGTRLSPESVDVQRQGGDGTIDVNVKDQTCWDIRPVDEWITPLAASGVGPGQVPYTVAPWDVLSCRTGTVSIGGAPFTVRQTGIPMRLTAYSAACDYTAQELPAITIEAIYNTTWGVTPECDWITVADPGSAKGNGAVTVAVAENPSYKPRVGTVKIGSETFSVTQGGFGRPVLSVEPRSSSLEGASTNGTVSVLATPDLPWSAASQTDWLVVAEGSLTGAGDGAIAYAVLPNPTLYPRTGTVVVSPEPASEVLPIPFSVTQPSLLAATIAPREHGFPVTGGSLTVNVTVSGKMAWKVEGLPAWLTADISSATGSGAVTLQAAANGMASTRTSTIRIAAQDFVVTQLGHGARIEYDETRVFFDQDGGSGSISVFPKDGSSWQAVSSHPAWLSFTPTGETVGDGTMEYRVAPMTEGAFRAGTITVGDQVLQIFQRAYEMPIIPSETKVTWRAGSGELQVSPAADSLWNAATAAPWITVDAESTGGTGPGTVRFSFAENKTGAVRSGTIVIAGEVFTLIQGCEGTTSTKVPYEWLDIHFPEGRDYEATAEVVCPNGLKAWENYAAGLDPADPEAHFFATITVRDDGASISWSPDLNAASVQRLYKVTGKKEITDAHWHWPARTGDRFFQVTAEVPNGRDLSDEAGKVVPFRHKGVQLWAGGPYWAEENIGAEEPWEPGFYFWWGDTVGYIPGDNKWIASDGSNDAFLFLGEDLPTYRKDPATLLQEGWLTPSGELAPSHDAARAHWGEGWRMPTSADFETLVNNTTSEWITTNGVQGRLVKGKGAYSSAAIFLPAAGGAADTSPFHENQFGYYGSTTPAPGLPNGSMHLYLGFTSCYVWGDYSRNGGLTIRPLHDGRDPEEPWKGTYAVRFHPGGATGEMADLHLYPGAPTAPLPRCDYLLEGYEFSGWGVEENGPVVYEDCAEVADLATVPGETIDLYALWAPRHEGVQLWENGPYWAETNVGAENPWDVGYHFWWGDTLGYVRQGNEWVASDGSFAGYLFSGENTPTLGKDNGSLQQEGWTDAAGNLSPAHDVAQIDWRNGWRMPTEEESTALIANTTTEWTTMNGVQGLLVKGKGAYSSASIFLPAGGSGHVNHHNGLGAYGHFWTSTPKEDGPSYAMGLGFDDRGGGLFYESDYDERDYARSIRPLRETTR